MAQDTTSAVNVPNQFRPVSVQARLDEPLSRWLWLVKWILLIPHIIVLLFLWLAFVLVTVVAFVAILVTATYPRTLFDFNLGVIRWSWRVSYYGYSALGTDRYPPFTLARVPDYPATVDIAYPERLSRGLVLVKWWLLAIPHYLVVGILAGGAGWTAQQRAGSEQTQWSSPGLIGLCVLFAAVALLFTARYPRGLYDLVIGANRWALRVLAYAALMTDRYPPFRLDQGGSEPTDPRDPAPSGLPSSTEAEPTTPPVTTPSSAAGPQRRGMTGPVVALVLGLLLFLPGAALGVMGVGGLWLNEHRDSAGYFTTSGRTISTDTAAVTAEDVNLHLDQTPGTWAEDDLGQLRIRVTESDGRPLFVGIAKQASVDRWLSGVAHEQVRDIDADSVRYKREAGTGTAGMPGEETFWAASADGSGTQALTWRPETGQWALVIMRADGSSGVQANVDIGAKAPSLGGLAIGLLLGGLLLIALGVGLVITGASGIGRRLNGPTAPGSIAAPEVQHQPASV